MLASPVGQPLSASRLHQLVARQPVVVISTHWNQFFVKKLVDSCLAHLVDSCQLPPPKHIQVPGAMDLIG